MRRAPGLIASPPEDTVVAALAACHERIRRFAALAERVAVEAATDADDLARIVDLADDPPPGTTLVIAGDDDHTRGRYEGAARGLVRELEALGAIRSWGRLDDDGDGGWQHRITVPAHRAQGARTVIATWLGVAMIDAAVEPR